MITAKTENDAQPVLAVDDLRVSFSSDTGTVHAVRGISFDVYPGETLGLVGESGSGKSVSNLALMGLVPTPPGRIESGTAVFNQQDLLTMPQKSLQSIRGNRIAMIFQDPMTALNPFMTIQEQLTEVTRHHLGHTKKQARMHAAEMLEMVGIAGAEKRMRSYPHEFSGGMRQRVMIALALSCSPDLLIADEPTTALDVTIQAQILDLLSDLQKRRGTAIIMITHDLGVVANVCDRVMVMYAGRIVEKADVFELFDNPQHPYTRGLLDSVPRFDANGGTLLKAIKGQPPLLSQLPEGCAFAPRCPHVIPRCESNDPVLQSLHVQSLHDDAQPLSHQRACDVMLPPTDDSTSHREVAS